MADSATPLVQIATAQAQKEVTVNNLVDALSPAAIFGRRAEACALLTWGYYGGRWGGTVVANGTLALDASVDNYIVANRVTGAVSLTTSDDEWNDPESYMRLYKVTTGAVSVESYEDHRAGPEGLVGGAGLLSLLADVDLEGSSDAPADGDVLAFDAATGKWMASTPVAAALAALVDVDVEGSSDAPVDGDVLTYNDALGKWTAATPAGGTAGLHSIPIMASSMGPSVAGGCAALASIASAANQPDIVTLDFDATTAEYAQFSVPMPKKWDGGTITAKFIWSHAATTTNFGVVWGLQAVAVSNDDPIAVAFGTAQEVADTGGTTDDLYTTDATAAITVAGTPAPEDTVFFRVYRDPTDGSDTMAIDARLHGVVLYITTNAENDA